MKRLPSCFHANVDAGGRGQGLKRDVHDVRSELRQLEIQYKTVSLLSGYHYAWLSIQQLTLALRMYSLRRGAAGCSRLSWTRIKGDALSWRLSNFEIKSRLWVRRCADSDGILDGLILCGWGPMQLARRDRCRRLLRIDTSEGQVPLDSQIRKRKSRKLD